MPGAPRIPPRENAYQFNNSGLGVLPAFGSSGLENSMPDQIQPLTTASGMPVRQAIQANIPKQGILGGEYIPRARLASESMTSEGWGGAPQPGFPGGFPAPGTPSGISDWRGSAAGPGQDYGSWRDNAMYEGMGPFAKLFKSITGLFNGGDSPENARTATPNGYGGGLLMNNTTYNSYRQPFGATYQQLASPGSMIGPTSGRVGNAYAGGPLGGRQPMGGPPPAGAQAFSSVVKARNIA